MKDFERNNYRREITDSTTVYTVCAKIIGADENIGDKGEFEKLEEAVACAEKNFDPTGEDGFSHVIITATTKTMEWNKQNFGLLPDKRFKIPMKKIEIELSESIIDLLDNVIREVNLLAWPEHDRSSFVAQLITDYAATLLRQRCEQKAEAAEEVEGYEIDDDD